MKYQKVPIKMDGYDNCYVDTNGVVYASDGSIVHYSVNHKGYFMVCLNGINNTVHRIVAETFIPNDRPGVATQINHKDGNKHNNSPDNLEWVTASENMQHAVRELGVNCSYRNGNARAIKGVNKYDCNVIYFSTIADAGRQFRPDNPNIGKQIIWRALCGRRKSAYDYCWYYDD